MPAETIALGIEDRFSGALTRLTTSLDAASKAADGIAARLTKVEQAGGALRSVGESAQKAGHGFTEGLTSFVKMTSAFAVGQMVANTVMGTFEAVKNAAIGLAQSAIQLNASLEQNRIAFGSLLGSAAAAEAKLTELWNFAAVTPFEFPQLVQASRTLLAFGFEAERIIPLMTDIGNVAAGLGLSSEGVQRMALSLGQMAAVGKTTGREMRELAMAGVSTSKVMEIIGRNMGKTTTELAHLQQTTGIAAEEFFKAFQEFSKVQFGGMMAEQAKTFNGAMSTIRDNLSALIRDGFTPLFDWVSKTAYAFSLFVQSKAWADIIAQVRTTTAAVAKMLPDIKASDFADAIGSMIGVLGNLADTINDNVVPAMYTFAAVIMTVVVPAVVHLSEVAIAGLLTKLATLDPLLLLIVGGTAVVSKGIQEMNKETRASQKAVDDAVGSWMMLGRASAEYRDEIAFLVAEHARLKDAVLSGTIGVVAYQDGLMKIANRMREIEKAIGPVTYGLVVNTDAIEAAGMAYQFMSGGMVAVGETSKIIQQRYEDLKNAVTGAAEGFTKLIDKMLASGDIGLAAGMKLKRAFGEQAGPGEWVASVIAQIQQAMAALPQAMQIGVMEQLGSIIARMKEGPEQAEAAAASLLTVLDRVNLTVQQITDLKRWQDMASAMVSGVAGAAAAAPGIIEKAVGELYTAGDLAAQQAKIQEEAVKTREEFQRLWEMQNRWKEQDAIATQKQQLALQGQQSAYDAARGKYAEMVAWNEQATQRQIEGYQKALVALGEFMAKQVMGQELAGKITQQEADRILGAYEKVFGAAAVAGVQAERAFADAAKGLAAYGVSGQIATAGVAKGMLDAQAAGKNVAQSVKQWGADMVTALQGAEKELGGYGEAGQRAIEDIITKAAQSKSPIDTVTAGIAEWKTKLDGVSGKGQAMDRLLSKLGEASSYEIAAPTVPVTEAEKSGKQTAADVVRGMEQEFGTKKTAIDTLGLNLAKELAAGMAGERAAQVVKDAVTTLVNWITARVKEMLASGAGGGGGGGAENAAESIGIQMMQGMAVGMAQGTESYVGPTVAESIQHIIDLFSQIRMPANVKEIADAVGGVMSAYKTALDALAALKDYAAPARSAVDSVYNDLEYIASRFMNWAATLSDWQAHREKINEYVGIVGGIASAFGTMVEAFVAMKGYTSPLPGVVERVVADLLYVADKMIEAAGRYNDELVLRAKLLAETAGAVGEALGKIVEPMRQAADFPPIMAGAYNNIADAIERWVRGMVWLAGRFKDEGLKAARALAETAGLIGDALAAVIEPFHEAGKFPAITSTFNFNNIADAIVRWLRGLSNMFADLEREGFPPEKAKALSEIVQVIGDALAAIVQPLRDAAAFAVIAPGAFTNLGDALYLMVKEMAGWKSRFGDLAALVEGFAALLDRVLSPFRTVIDVVDGLAKLTETLGNKTWDWAATLGVADTALYNLMARLQQWKTDFESFGYDLEALGTFGDALSRVVSPFQSLISVVDGLAKLSETLGAKTWDWALALGTAGTALYNLMARILQWKVDFEVLGYDLEAMAAFGGKLAAALSPFQAVTSTVEGLARLTTTLADKTWDWTAALTILDDATRRLLGLLAAWMGGGGGEAQRIPLVITKEMAEYAAALAAALSPFQAVVSLIGGLADLSDKLGKKTYDWALIVGRVGMAMREVILELGKLASMQDVRDALKKIPADFSTALQNAFGPIKTAIDALNALADYKGFAARPPELKPPQVEALARDIQDFLNAFAEAARHVKITPELQAAATALGQIVGPVKDYIDAFYWIYRYVGIQEKSNRAPLKPGELPKQFIDIASDLSLLVQAIYRSLDALPDDMLGTVTTWSTSLQAVFTLINAALDAMTSIEGRRRPLDFANMVAAFATDLTTLVQTIAGAFTAAGSASGAYAQALANLFAFGTALGHRLGEGAAAGWTARYYLITDAVRDWMADARVELGPGMYELGDYLGDSLVAGMLDAIGAGADALADAVAGAAGGAGGGAAAPVAGAGGSAAAAAAAGGIHIHAEALMKNVRIERNVDVQKLLRDLQKGIGAEIREQADVGIAGLA